MQGFRLKIGWGQEQKIITGSVVANEIIQNYKEIKNRCIFLR